MAKRGRPFEQRYYYQEAGKSERAALQPAMSNIASGDSSEAAGVQVEQLSTGFIVCVLVVTYWYVVY